MKKNKKKISIIVPVYNGEETIERCVDSLIKQTYKNIEILLINDGSKDNTLNILRNYEKKYSKIKVFSHENSGVGKTRNLGIDKATGDFVTFVDADDGLELDAIETLVKNIDKNTQVVISGIKRKVEETGEIIFDIKPKNCIWSELKYTATQFKMYKKDYLDQYKIRYKSFRIGEDVLFCLSCFSNTKYIKIISESKYINYFNPNSVTLTMNSNGKKYDILPLLKKIKDEVSFKKYDCKMNQYFYIKTIVQNVIMQLDGLSVKELNDIYINNYKWLKKQNINGDYIKLHWQSGETFNINSIVNCFIIFTRIKCTKLLIFCLRKSKKIRMK